MHEHVFPWHLFHQGERIGIYGGGRVGRDFYRQVRWYDYIDVAVIVDEKECPYIPDVPVKPVNALIEAKVDAVLIAEIDEGKACEIQKNLVDMGIAEEMIRWDGTKYRRHDFFQNYYFPKLQKA